MEEQEERFENLLRLSKGLFDSLKTHSACRKSFFGRLNGIAADDYQE